MSFILDALKKADRERNLSKVPTLTTVHIPVYVTGRRIALWTVAGAILGGAALVWWLQSSTEGPVATVQSRPAVAVTTPVRPADPGPGPGSGAAASSPPTASPEPVPTGPSVAQRPGARRQAERDRTVGLRPSPPAPKPLPVAPPAPLQPEIRETRPVESAPPVLPSPRPEAQPSVEANRTPPVVIPAAPPPASPAPPTLREALSKMTLDVFVYTDVEADRMAVINGRRYVKGQLVDGLYLVDAINPDGVVLKYRDEQAVLRP